MSAPTITCIGISIHFNEGVIGYSYPFFFFIYSLNYNSIIEIAYSINYSHALMLKYVIDYIIHRALSEKTTPEMAFSMTTFLVRSCMK